MSRLSLRLRLTAVFVLVMGVVLALIGTFLYLRTKQNIDDSIAASLRARQGALATFAADPPRGVASRIPAGERYAQLLRADGTVLESRPAGERPMLTAVQRTRAVRGVGTFELPERVRYVAGPTRVDGRRAIAVAATSLADHERALEGLGGALLVGGPLALLIAGGIGYAIAAAALRPVDEMRRRAASISRAEPDARLPVPVPDDEVRRLAETLNDMLARLATASETERRLIANASHELRTPLAALRAELDLALRPGTSPEDLRRALELVREDAVRLTALSDGLLDLSRQDEAGVAARAPVDVPALLADVHAQLRSRAAAEGRRVLRGAAPDVTVDGDRQALGRAWLNLADNALVHGSGDVVLGADRDGDAVVLWVRDEGAVDDATAAVAFERFARGPGATGRRGAGLGLSLVRTIAAQHGGDAVLRDLGGRGVRAEVRLPTGRR